MLNNKRFVTVLLLALFSLASHSQVYKWVDENGKVHYSDKKPAADAVELNVDHAVMPEPKIINEANPIYYDGNDPARWVVMTQPAYLPPEIPGQKKKMAHFYFGADCAKPTSINLQQLEQRYPEIFPKDHRYFKQITNAFYDNGYQLAMVKNQELRRQLEATQGHRLVATIIETKLDACVKKLESNQRSQNLADFRSSAFETVQHWVQIKWMLYDSETLKLVYEYKTEGVSSRVEEKRNAISIAMRESLSSATEQLLSDSLFVALLQPPSTTRPSSQNINPQTSQTPRTPAMVEEHFNKKYKGRAQFVEILTVASYLRTASTEHFLRDDTWPTDINDVNIRLSELYSKDQVRSIRLRRGGTIELDVSPSFGRNKAIWLIPTDTKRRVAISWKCQTNVEVGNNIGNCKSF